MYGDNPNKLPFIEKETRWELPYDHLQYEGIDENNDYEPTSLDE